jgi:hypothetical protein
MWFLSGTVDVMVYTNETQKSFWGESGIWSKSKLPLEHRIVIIADSVSSQVNCIKLDPSHTFFRPTTQSTNDCTL